MPTKFVTNPRRPAAKRNPRRPAAKRNPRAPSITATVEQDRLSGGWSVYLHDGRRNVDMTGDAFSTEAAAKREAKALLAQARAGVPLETLVSMFWEKHYKPFAGHELDNPRRRNPSPFGEDYVEKVYGDWGAYTDVRAKELVSLAKAFGATARAVAVRGSGKKVVVRFSKGSWWASVEAFNPFAEAFKAWDARRAEANTAWNRDNGPSPDTLDLVSDLLPKARRKNPPKGVRIAGPAVKTMVDRLRISKADAQRLKDMMDTGAPRILQAADKMMDGNGVERISGAWAMGGGLMYVNMGDTYDTTLIYDYKTNRFVVSSWGDIVERQPRRFAD